MGCVNVITGLPRSGSTLLCNILNQNPEFHASSTSGILQVLRAMQHQITTSDEFKSYAINDRSKVEQFAGLAMQSVVEKWYDEEIKAGKTVFDKCRGWSHNSALLRHLYPQSKMIVTVRDLRGVFGSVEKQHRKTALWDATVNQHEQTVAKRAENMFAIEGLLGSCIQGIDDLQNRVVPDVLYVRIEDLTSEPSTEMAKIYDFLELDAFDHNLELVTDTAEDVDQIYNNKFPHHGNAGAVKPMKPRDWESIISGNISDNITNLFPEFQKRFRYY